MSKQINDKKSKQLGMSFGTAQNRLRKQIMFDLLNRLDKLLCFRCSKKITTVHELSVDHKQPWLDSETDLFWDLNNIAFSHLSCNCKARKSRKKTPEEWLHGAASAYRRGCRCTLCVEWNRTRKRKYRQKKQSATNGT